MFRTHYWLLLLSLSLLPFAPPSGAVNSSPNGASSDDRAPIDWREYNAEAFKQARSQGRFILLDLEAVWCHWCHVMDATTYQDKAVATLLAKHFIALKVDHDARPDLAERYRDWGWPATIVFAPDGSEIVKRAGYIAPDGMARLLQAIIDDPSPEGRQTALPDQFSDSPVLSASLREQLQQRHLALYDHDLGGLKLSQKFIDADSVEWDLALAEQGDQAAAKRARQTLDAALALIDPAFGGAYQYSTHYDWQHPHYEKIMRTQRAFLRVYSRAYALFKLPRYAQAAESVADYLGNFLSAQNGAFYASQDADLKQGTKGHDYFAMDRQARLKAGMPRINKHQYTEQNAMAIEGLLALAAVSKDNRYLKRALAAVAWVEGNRRYAGGGFKHDRRDLAGPYLSDTLYMGRVYLALFEISGEKAWLKKANRAAGFIERYFKHPQAGLVSAVDNGTPVAPLPKIEHNIDAARFLNRLIAASASERYAPLRDHVLRYLVTDAIALARPTESGVLLANLPVPSKAR